MDNTELTRILQDMVKNLGAFSTGVVTTETLSGGPPSADLTYVLPGARSALCFALSMEQEPIELYLQKADHDAHNLDKIRKTTLASGIALEVAAFLEQLGYKSVPLPANFQYRNDGTVTYAHRQPPVSHRYLAVRSGIGHFGFSGNVITRDHGAAIVLASVVTEAVLEPTAPLPAADNFCDNCRLCRAVCASGFMSADQLTEVSLGGHVFEYSKRNTYARCSYVCGGYAGLSRSGKWSTWSPSRYPIPEADADFPKAFAASVDAYIKRPIVDHVYYNSVKPGFRTEYTCSHCQLICHPDRAVRERRCKMVLASGVVAQNLDGSRDIVTPAEAKKRIEAMAPDRKRLYEPQ